MTRRLALIALCALLLAPSVALAKPPGAHKRKHRAVPTLLYQVEPRGGSVALVADLERDLVDDCREAAKAMGAFLAEVGQRRAKGSGTTTGYPDLTLICAGHVVLIEVKRPATADHPHGYLTIGQTAFIDRAAEQGVVVHVVDSLQDFVEITNACRRR